MLMRPIVVRDQSAMSATGRTSRLVREAVEGSGTALTLLLMDSRPELRTYLTAKVPAILRGRVDVDDLVQETHIEIYRRLSSFTPQGPDAFERWIRTIAIGKLRDAIRRQKRAKHGGGCVTGALDGGHLEDSMIALIDVLSAGGTTPSRAAQRSEAAAAVETALASLPEDPRQAVWLVHIEGLGIAEAARLMERTERSIHGLLRRGLRKLRELLGRESQFLTRLG